MHGAGADSAGGPMPSLQTAPLLVKPCHQGVDTVSCTEAFGEDCTRNEDGLID